MKSTIRRITLLAMGFATAAALTACSGGGDEAPVETNVVNIAEPDNLAIENLATPEPSPSAAVNASAAATPEPALPDEAQIQDDADAAGMTARVDRGEDNGAVPAE